MRRLAALTLALLLLLGSCGAPEPEKEEAAAEVVPVQQETEETDVELPPANVVSVDVYDISITTAEEASLNIPEMDALLPYVPVDAGHRLKVFERDVRREPSHDLPVRGQHEL